MLLDLSCFSRCSIVLSIGLSSIEESRITCFTPLSLPRRLLGFVEKLIGCHVQKVYQNIHLSTHCGWKK